MEREREREREIIARCTAAVRNVWPECLAEAQKYVDRNMDRVVGLMSQEHAKDRDVLCSSSSSQMNNRSISAHSNPQSNGDRALSNCLSSQEDGSSTRRSDGSSSGGSRDGSGSGTSNADHSEKGDLPVKSVVDGSDKTARYPAPEPPSQHY